MKAILIILVVLLVVGLLRDEKGAAWVNGARHKVESLFSESTVSGKALQKPETMTPEQRQLATEWSNGSKRLYVEQVDALENRLAQRMEGGYVWGAEAERRVRAAIRDLNNAIDRDDFLAVPSLFAEAKESLRLFEAGCRWRAGLRHSSISHISSAEREGYWNADPGWRFFRQGSLEVARNCYRCNGSGQVIVKVDCDRCNGTGWVDTPLSGVTGFLEGVADALQAVDDIKHKRRTSHGGGRRHSDQMKCPVCNGRRTVETTEPCHACGGQGWTR